MLLFESEKKIILFLKEKVFFGSFSNEKEQNGPAFRWFLFGSFWKCRKNKKKKEPQGLSCEWLFDHPHGVLVLFLFGITEVTAFSRDNAGAFKHLAANEVVDLSGIRAFAERRAFSKVVRV